CFRKTGDFLKLVQEAGVDPIEVPLGSSLLRPQTALSVTRVAAQLRADGANLVHCHDLYATLLGVPAALVAGLPVIASRRDLGHHVTAIQKPALHLALRSATVILANAATVASQLERDEKIRASQIAIIPNGLDVSAFDEAARHLGAPAPVGNGGPPTVVTVARMTYPAKGHD